MWFGWNGKVTNQPDPPVNFSEHDGITFATMSLSRRDHAQYYNGFANRALWPMFHYRMDLARFNREHYSSYVGVNKLFAEHLSGLLEPNDLLWIHDYHLIPLAIELRQLGHRQPMGFFLHTPFPAREVLTVLPAYEQLVTAMCEYDLVGFQTENDRHAFLDCVRDELGGHVRRNSQVELGKRKLSTGVFPIGIDPEPFMRAALNPERLAWGRRLRERYGGANWLIGVDRLDYSKGLIERFVSFERFLDKYPEYRRKVTFFQIAPPSRAEVPEYKAIRHELEAEAGHINGRFADLDWLPINYINKSFSRDQLAMFYRLSRIGLVTPLRDGMNLVAKEYVASQNPSDPGVLILSRFAGAARQLDAALIVNPFAHESVADAIHRALEMSLDERRERFDSMMKIIQRDNLEDWGRRYLSALGSAAKRIQAA